jgi:type I restriction enzyme M protein
MFADQAGQIFKVLMEDCNVHTVLRCPRGTFAPYTAGTKTNVVFFTKGQPTKTLWLYDGRANVPSITKKSRPLTPAQFAAFEHCYGGNPNGTSRRAAADSTDDRWRSFGIEEIIERGYKIDSLKWLRDDEPDDADGVLDPMELVTDAIAELQAAVIELHELQKLLDDAEVEA